MLPPFQVDPYCIWSLSHGKSPRQLYHVDKTWTVLLYKLHHIIYAQYYTKHHYGRKTDDYLGESTSLGIVDHSVDHYMLSNSCNIHQILFYFAILSINLINIMNYNLVIDQAALTIVYNKNTIS